MKRLPEYVGYWACLHCGSRAWASAMLGDPMHRPPCPGCLTGRMIPDRRATFPAPWHGKERREHATHSPS